MKTRKLFKSCLAFAALLGVSAGTPSCVDEVPGHIEGVQAFVVVTRPAVGADYGTEATPLKYATAFEDASGVCPAGETCYNVELGAYAVDIAGNFLPDFNGEVAVSSVPGKLNVETLKFVNGKVGDWSFDGQGKPKDLVSGQTVGMRYAFGSTRVWFEDKLEILKANMPNQHCVNGKEKEGGVYCEPTLATGVGAQFTFEPQSIRMIQYNPEQKDGQSPINKEYAQLKARPGHDLVVTNVVSTGFYITDLADTDYNSIFIFTFSQPSRVEIGDRVCEVSGGIAEFTGMTQLQFPSWGIQNKERSTAEDTDPAPEDGEQGAGSCVDKETGLERPCTDEELEAMGAIVDCFDVYHDPNSYASAAALKEARDAFAFIEAPAPKVVTPDLLALSSRVEKNATGSDGSKIKTSPVQTEALERLESSVVTIQDVRLSTEFVNCDDNGNSKIESNTEEAECRKQCQEGSKRCTEWSNLESYDQWKAWTVEGDAEISVASSTLIANFDIAADCEQWIDPETNRRMMRCPDRHLLRLTGNLKQVLPGCSGDSVCYSSKFNSNMIMSVIEPRISTDLIMDEEYNKKAKAEFDQCWGDTQKDGCRDTCKWRGSYCTCKDFADFRTKVPAADKPSKCAGL